MKKAWKHALTLAVIGALAYPTVVQATDVTSTATTAIRQEQSAAKNYSLDFNAKAYTKEEQTLNGQKVAYRAYKRMVCS